MAQLILVGLLLIPIHVLSLYLFPFRPCMWCKGTGRNKGSNARRFGECRHCKHSGRVRRIGAKTVHRGAVSLAEKARQKKQGK